MGPGESRPKQAQKGEATWTTTSPVPIGSIICVDCGRGFSLVTDKQRARWAARGDRCPTCGFNAMGREAVGFVPRTVAQS